MAELFHSEAENKATAKADAGEQSTRPALNQDASPTLFAETLARSRGSSLENGENSFDRNRRFSADMADRGELPQLQIDDKGKRVQSDARPTGVDEETEKEVLAGMKDARTRTKGWDSTTAPSAEELKDKIGESKVLFWGDDHLDENSPERLKNALDSLKKSGVDTVAMEGFREDQQQLVNDWLSAKPGSEEERTFATQMRAYLDKALNNKTDSDKTMQVMKELKTAGLKVLCMEPDGGKINYGGDGEDKNRDENWLKVIQNYLDTKPDSKVMVFAGSTHFSRMPEPNFADRTAQNGIKTTDLTPPSQYFDGPIKILSK